MHMLRYAVLAGAVMLVAAPSASAGSMAMPRPKTLTFTATGTEIERGKADAGKTGLSKGDTFVMNAKLRNTSGKLAGTWQLSCTMTDEDQDGNAWSVCDSVAVIKGRGTIVATGANELLDFKSAPGGFGVAPPRAELAVVGGTGAYVGAMGHVVSTATKNGRKMVYRFATML